MVKGGQAGKPARKQEGGKVVTDSRFAAVHYDPRFQRFPKAKAKVEIDERFAGMFNDPSFQVRSVVDKRGRKAKGERKGEDMRRYYRLRDEHAEEAQRAQQQAEQAQQRGEGSEGKGEEEEQGRGSSSSEEEGGAPAATGSAGGAVGKGKSESKSENESGSEEEDEEDEEERARNERWARMRGLAGPEVSSSEEEEDKDELEGEETSSEEEEGEEEEEEEEESELEEEWGVGAMAANPDEQIPLSEATRRLAVVDLDWAHIRAVDIFAVLRSFLPTGGKIERVVVYPSDYGLQRMAKEASMGPQCIWKSKQAAEAEAAAAAAAAAEAAAAEQEGGGGAEGSPDSDDSSGEVEGKDALQRRLQLYERSKLRWYYAVVECDSVVAASALYDGCDGMEFLKSACKFDLRFVPDEQSFDGRPVRDEAVEVPQDYEPPTFQTKALQHTNVQLTWDADDEGRKRALTKKMTADDIKEDDFKAYLASESEEEPDPEGAAGGAGEGDSEDEAAVRERYRRLLLGVQEEAAEERKGRKDWGGGGGEDEEGEEEGGSSSEDGSRGEEDEEGAAGTRARVKNDKGMEMEVTFVPGLEGLGERLLAKRLEKEARKGETVWEAYLRRKKEKRAEARRLGKKHVDSHEEDSENYGSGSGDDEDIPADVKDDPFFQHEDDPFDDPFFKDGGKEGAEGPAAAAASGKSKGSKQKGSKQQHEEAIPVGKKKEKKVHQPRRGEDGEEETMQRAELEMLLLDEVALAKAAKRGAAGVKDSAAATPKLSKKERMRLRKEARRRERQEGSDEEDIAEAGAPFKVDLSDPRFGDMFTSHHFALDPTDPRYKQSEATQAIVREAAKRREGGASGGGKKQRGAGALQNGVAAAAVRGGADEAVAVAEKQAPAPMQGGAAGADLKLMVASLKRKSQQLQRGPKGGKGAGGPAAGAHKKKRLRA